MAATTAIVALAITGCTSTPGSAVSSSSVAASAADSGSGSAEAVESVGSATDTASRYAGTDPIATTTEAQANTVTTAAPDPSLPAASTEVPAPGGGDINQTVAPVDVTTNSAVALTATADAGTGVKVNLGGIESITATAEMPGEVAGPALKITITIVNGSSAALDLTEVQVNVADGAGAPAIPMSASPANPFAGSLAPGANATGIYVFTIPTSYANPAAVSVSYSSEAPVLLFVGDAK